MATSLENKPKRKFSKGLLLAASKRPVFKNHGLKSPQKKEPRSKTEETQGFINPSVKAQ
jgi:hypothetical protein